MFFKCQITDPRFSKDIRFGHNELNTIESIKNKIVIVLRIGLSQFDIDNPPSEQQMKTDLKGYELKISIKNRCEDVKFKMPDEKQFTIPSCYRMKFDDVIKFFRQKGYKYNLQFFISGKETLRVPYPFFAVPTNSVVNVQIKGDTVTLNFDNKTFNFPENTFVKDAYNTILDLYKKDTKINLISIINTTTHERIIGGYPLKSTEKYLVTIMCPYSFKNKTDSSYKSYQHFDFFAKVLDAKQRLAPQLSIKMTVKPKNVVIYDQNGSEVEDDDLFLREIHNYQGDIYFDIVKKASKSDKKSTKKEEKKQIQSTNTKLDSDESEPKPKTKSIVTKKDEIEEKQPENQNEKQSEDSSAQESFSKSEKKASQKTSLSKSQIMKSMKINPLPKQQSKSTRPKQGLDLNEKDRISTSKTTQKQNQTKSMKNSDSDSDEKDRNSVTKKTKNQDHTKRDSNSNSDENSDIDSTKDQIQSKLKLESDSEESKAKSIEIKFMFDESSEEKFESYSEKVPIDKTIEELEEEISSKYNIDNKIVIGYKSGKNLFEIEYDMNIEDVIDDIKTETKSNKIENILYIKITQKPKKVKSTRPMKPKPVKPLATDKPKPAKQEPEPSKPKQDKQQESKQVSSQKSKSKKKQETESDDDREDEFVEPVKKPKNTKKKKNQYRFTYKEKQKKLTLDPESSLEDNEEEIREKFGLKEEEKIEFFISDPDEEDDEEEDKSKIDHERKMKTLKNFTIEIHVIKNKKKEIKDKKETKGTKEKYKYYYQTNKDDEIKEIELEEGTKVKEFKKEICRLNEVDNLANIKVIFAGKDLLNDIVLDELNVGGIVLYIYIRTTQDILLMTAKALQFNKNEFEEDEEEESESEDDD